VKILALDTATENCSAALFLDGAIIARERRLAQGHAGQILPMVDEVLAEAGVGLGALSAIAFGRGPGAFTGVRLAASVTQGLAFGAGIPVVPVSDLRALAQRALAVDPAVQRVLACTDARMREVYWGCFERLDGLAAPACDEQLSAPEAVRLPAGWKRKPDAQAYASGGTLAASGSQPIGGPTVPPTDTSGPGLRERLLGAGLGFAAYPALGAALRADLDGIRDDLLGGAREIAVLGAQEVAAGRVFPPEQALPIYLRNDVVQPPPRSH
jgi:tRNA threonylcarbamoyladenosine biosynthesis protein TsaB